MLLSRTPVRTTAIARGNAYCPVVCVWVTTTGNAGGMLACTLLSSCSNVKDSCSSSNREA